MVEEQPVPPENVETLRGAAEPNAADFVVLWQVLPFVRWSRGVLWGLLAFFLLPISGMLLAGDFVGVLIVPAAVFAAALLLLRAWSGGWSARRLEQLGKGTVRYELGEAGVKMFAPRATRQHSWSAFQSFQVRSEVMLLRPEVGPWLLLPARAFDAQTFELVRLLVRRHIEERGGLHAGWKAGLLGAAIVAFLSVWHFLSVDAPPPRGARSLSSASPLPEVTQSPEGSPGGAPARVEELKQPVGDLERYLNGEDK